MCKGRTDLLVSSRPIAEKVWLSFSFEELRALFVFVRSSCVECGRARSHYEYNTFHFHE
jgi:hypothetical protein